MGATHNLTTANGTVTITPSNNIKIATWREYDSTGNNYKPGYPKHYVGTGPAGDSTNTASKDEITGGLDAITIGEHRRLSWVEETWVIKNDTLNFKKDVLIKKRTVYQYGTKNNAWKPKGWVGTTGLTSPANNHPKVIWSVVGNVSNEPYKPGTDNFITAVTTPGAARKKWKKELWRVHDTWSAGGATNQEQTKRKRMAYEKPARGDYLGFNRGYHNPFQPSCNFAINHNHVGCKANVMLLIEPGDEEVKQVNFKALWQEDTTTYAPAKTVTTQETNGDLAPTRNQLNSGTKLVITQTGDEVGKDIDNLYILGTAKNKKLKFQMEIIDHGNEQGLRLNDHGPCTVKPEPSETVVPMNTSGERLKICTDADADFEALLDNNIHFAVELAMTQHDTSDPANDTEYRIEIMGGFNQLQASKRWEQLQDYYESSNYTYELDGNKIRSSKGTWSTLSNTSSNNINYLPCFKMLSHTIDRGLYWDHSTVENRVITVRVLKNTGTTETPIWTNVTKPSAEVKIKMKRAATEPIFWLPNFVYGTGSACFDTPGDDGKPVAISSRSAIEGNSDWNPPSVVEYYTGGNGCVVTPITSADVLEANFYWEFTTRSKLGTGAGSNQDKVIYMNELLDYHDSFIYEKGSGETDEQFAARKPNGKKRSIGGRPHIMRTSKNTGDSGFTDLKWRLSHSKGTDTPIEITGYIVANGHKTQCQVLDYYCKDDNGTGNYVIVRPSNTDTDDRYSQENQEINMAKADNHLRIISQTGSIPSLVINSITSDTTYTSNDDPLDLRLNLDTVDSTDFKEIRARMDNYIDDPLQVGDESKQMDFTFTYNDTTGYWSGVRTGTAESVLAESEKIEDLNSLPLPSPSEGDNKVYPTMGAYSARIAGYDSNGNWLASSHESMSNVAPTITTTTTSTATTTNTSTTTTGGGSFTFTDSAVSQSSTISGEMIDYFWSLVNPPSNLTGFEVEISTNGSDWVEADTSTEGGLGSSSRQYRFPLSDLTNSGWYPDGAPNPLPSTGNSIYFRAVMKTGSGDHRTSGYHHTIASATTTTATQTSMTSMTSMTSNTTTTTAPKVYGTSIDWAYEEAGPKRAEINVSWSPFTPPSGSVEGYVIKIYESDSSDATGSLITTENISSTENNSATVSILASSISGFDSKLSVGKYIKAGVSATYDMGKTTAETLNNAAGGTQIAVSTAQTTTTTGQTITTTSTTTTTPAATTQAPATTEDQTSASVAFGSDPEMWLSSTSGSGNMTLSFNMYAAGSPQYHDLEFKLKNGSNFTTPNQAVIQVHDISSTSKSYTFQSNSGDTIQARTRGKSHTGTGGTNGAWSEWGDFEWTLGNEKTY